MADTNISITPDFISPMNTFQGNTYVLQNDGYTASNFKFLIKTFLGPTSSPTFLVKESIPPRSAYGEGLYTPYNTISANLNTDWKPNLSVYTYADTNSIKQYYIQYGQQYNPQLNITNIYDYIVGATAYFGFDFNGTISYCGLTSGDVIQITSQNPYYSGEHLVLFSGDPITGGPTPSLIIDVPFTTDSGIGTGMITNVERWEGYDTTTNHYGIYAARQYTDTTDWSNKLFTIYSGSNGVMFLTNQDNYIFYDPNIPLGDFHYFQNKSKSVKLDDYETLTILLPIFNYTDGCKYIVWFYKSNGTLITSRGYTLNSSDLQLDINKIEIPSGPKNWQSMGVDFTDISYYTITVRYAYNHTETRLYKVDRTCSIYNNTRLGFLNQYGCYEFFNFTKDNKQSLAITRNEYTKELPFFYSIGDRERTVLSNKITEQHLVNSDWIDENTYYWLKDLVSSIDVYYSNDVNNPVPIMIIDSNFEIKTTNRNRIFNLLLTYEHSVQYGVQKQ